jgi:hypothetical protein
MKIAYLVLAHKLPEQLIRLIKTLNTVDTSFFIHVDRNTEDETHAALVGFFRSYDNVHFIKRHYCKWGDSSLVKATLSGLKYLVKSEIPYDYVILLSGQDYPIKSNDEIQAYLQKNNGFSFLQYSTTPHNMAGRIEHWHFRIGRRHYIIPAKNMFGPPLLNKIWNPIAQKIKWRRKLPGNLKPYFGSQFWCLSREFVDSCLKYLAEHKGYEKFMKLSYIPDEFFFQSVFLNSSLRPRIINTDLRYKDFSDHNRHPKVLDKQDFNILINSNFLFARKFDLAYDSEILDMIDECISN